MYEVIFIKIIHFVKSIQSTLLLQSPNQKLILSDFR